MHGEKLGSGANGSNNDFRGESSKSVLKKKQVYTIFCTRPTTCEFWADMWTCVTHVLYNAGLYIIRVRLCINHGNLAIFSDILRFFYTISLSITWIIFKIRLYIVCHRCPPKCSLGSLIEVSKSLSI